MLERVRVGMGGKFTGALTLLQTVDVPDQSPYD